MNEPMPKSFDPARSAEGPAFCGEFDIRIDRNGEWHYQGSPIGRKEMVRLFASILSRDEAGVYWLSTPAERGRIRVDDVPFVAIAMSVSGAGKHQILTFRTNVGDAVIAGRDHPLRVDHDAATGEPSPYVTVRQRIEARIARAVYYDLVELGTEKMVNGEPLYGVWSGGIFFPLGKLDDRA